MKRAALIAMALLAAGCATQRGTPQDGVTGSAYIADDGVYAQPKERGLSVQEAATDKNVIGCVKVEYVINTDGSARDVQILRSVPAGYYDARVLRAMEQIKFASRPAMGFGTRTFSFGPSQSRDVLDSAARLCERSAEPEALPPPPEPGKDAAPYMGAPTPDKKGWTFKKPVPSENPRRPSGRH